MDKVLLTNDELDLNFANQFVQSSSAGSTSIFLGTTRDFHGDKQVEKLSYEAYNDMAEKQMQKICADIRNKWKVINICIMHRLGEVPVKGVSVIIAISSAHREDCLKAVQYCINTLKATVPIWKKEIYSDGTSSWKENCENYCNDDRNNVDFQT